MAGISKERQLQMERRKKAALFMSRMKDQPEDSEMDAAGKNMKSLKFQDNFLVILALVTSFKSVFMDMYCIQDSNLVSVFPCYDKVSLLKFQPIMQCRYYFSLQRKKLVGKETCRKFRAMLLSLLPNCSVKSLPFIWNEKNSKTQFLLPAFFGSIWHLYSHGGT